MVEVNIVQGSAIANLEKLKENVYFVEEFEVNYNKRNRKFCSRECYYKSEVGKGNPFYGKHHSQKTKIKIRISKRGQIPWNKGKVGIYSKETLEKIKSLDRSGRNNPMYGKRHTQTTKRKIGLKTRERCENFEYKERLVKAIMKGWQKRPNKPERLLIKFLNQIFPDEFKYVGDGQLILGGKCPDFLNINGKKKLIELFGDYWHSKERTGIEPKEHERKRIEHFKRFGFDTLIIWEHELKDLKRSKNV